jgi:hypothetical protein
MHLPVIVQFSCNAVELNTCANDANT